MAKRGRKSTFNDTVREAIIKLSEAGKTKEQIADIVGISTRTISTWMGKHQDFGLAVREARQVADELVVASLFSKAIGYSHKETKVFQHEGQIVCHDIEKHYPPDTSAIQFWLRNRQPKEWKEKNESDINVNANLNVNKLTDEELDAKIKELENKINPEQ